MDSENKPTFIFEEPRLKMTYAGRLFVRAASAVGYVTFFAGIFTTLSSDSKGLQYFGLFLLLSLFDRLKHWGEGDAPLSELPKEGEANLAGYFLPKTYKAIERAFERSGVKKSNFYLELASVLLASDQIKKGFLRLDIKIDEFSQKLESLLSESEGRDAGDARENQIKILAGLAADQALRSGHRFIRSCDLFSSLASLEDEYLKRLFHMFSLSAGDIESAILITDFATKASKHSSLGGASPELHRGLRHRIMNRAWTARPTPTLDKFGDDYTDLARAGAVGFLIGHDKEYERLAEILGREQSPNALLVGEIGIGKETIIAHLAFNIIKDKAPQALFDKRLVGLDVARMIAGATPEEVQLRIQKIVGEIIAAENIILYLPEVHNLLRTSGAAYMSAADALLPLIQDSKFPVIGTTYPKEFKREIEARSDFLGLFEVIKVEEISEEEARKILTLDGIILEKKTGVAVSFGAVKMSITLAKKYFSGVKFLPRSAEDLLVAAMSRAEQKGEKKVSPEDVIAAAEAKINIPIHEAGRDEAEALLNFEEIIHKKFINQDEAVRSVGNALREYRSGLSRKGGPIASFLFVGPTGVGKTELAKLVAEIQFGSKTMMARFDMTEYQDKKSFERFIGSADGSIRGVLTEAVLAKPYSLILLDEFEKAFPDILDLFLQVLDDGRLTDGLGRTVDFQNTIIIATSNAHSDIINQALSEGQSMSDIAEYLKKRLTDVFKPELINRFSRAVIFRNLEPKELVAIANIQLEELGKTLGEQGISIKFDPSVAAYVVKLGYDPAFGARPIRRVIEEKFRSALAEKILRKEIDKGSEVVASIENDQLVFRGG